MGEPAPFSSAFSIADFALACDARIEPITLVQGCEVRWLHQTLPAPLEVPARWGGKGPAWEVLPVDGLAEQVSAARRGALERLRAQAADAGADGVVAIRELPGVFSGIVGRQPSRGLVVSRMLEYQMLGTAVRYQAQRSPHPRLASLPVSDVWKLGRSGWQPMGVAMGCSYQFCPTVWAGTVAAELPGASAAWESARRSALEQLESERRSLGAQGLVAVELQSEHRHFEWNTRGLHATALLVGVTALATAISRSAAAPVGAQAPSPILRLI
jgi:uncharacterized protein YbjQ (UPF0145 family)